MASAPIIRAGLQIPDFNRVASEPGDLMGRLAAVATTAEDAGFDSIYVMDHLHQIRGVGPQENWMLEGNTALGALAAVTEKAQLGLMVGGIHYRNPALMAKATTTIDVLSGGRAILGIGAAWNDVESLAYGYEFPPLGVRFEMLEDGLRICRAMFTSGPGTATVDGERHHVKDAYNNPQPLRGNIPILIGGSGEKKTLRMVAQYADASNVFGDVERIKHLMSVIDGHCETVGRDPGEITRTKLATLIVGATHEEAAAAAEPLRGPMGERFEQVVLFGDPDGIAEQCAAHREAGLDGIIVNMPQVGDLEKVELAGKTLSAAMA
ncbi:MAG TPA: LLM class F420-dependent oxidoreductase [Baekduia sp.]|uniref:LLM class F420-dependent oxidoreductase n=1 Tax=Baekduia sp. TaxID=2600305 RepID=UPI002D78CD54|nr:LLM class F420-dependent oxidoreductase [Baekduia sp.]HET6508138.1 LLM class F420-dependent oxidoreductase [Baekduia sp.]